MTTSPLRLLEELAPAFPPFTKTTWELATELEHGDTDQYSELLSINGHLLLHLETRAQGVLFRLYWAPAPHHPREGNARKPVAEEWTIVSKRLLDTIPMLEAHTHTTRNGLVYYERQAKTREDLIQLIAAARRIAGLTPPDPTRPRRHTTLQDRP